MAPGTAYKRLSLLRGTNSMREFAKAFYTSRAWADCRAAYKKSVGGLCERCLKAGRYSPWEIVHHKIHISPENINDPEIALSFDNLQLVCRDCHAQIHDRRKRRYKVDELGRVVFI